MNNKTLILVCEFDSVQKDLNKDSLVNFFESTDQKGQKLYEQTLSDGFTIDVYVCTLDEFISLANKGDLNYSPSSDYLMKIEYAVKTVKTIEIL